jgi:hypothetical protein
MNTTKEGIEVKPGQVWVGLDKRSRGRIIHITEVYGGFAHYKTPRKGRISIQRMHKSSTGYALLRNIGEEPDRDLC